MSLVRERRHQQALHLSLPPPFSADFTSYDYECSFYRLNSSVGQVIKVFNDLEKIHVVGHGSSSSVYKVRHRKTGSVYALKVLRPDPYGGGSMVNPTREAEIITNVNSDFLLRCHGVIYHAGKLCFVTEYMDYGSLHDALRAHERLPEVVISTVASRVLKGLKYLHGMQIVHNDIKPSNLLINGNGEVKIADFGLSTKVILGSPSSSQMGQGTWAYMSPERFDPERWGSSDSGFAGDVWALGVVLLECFLGQHPFIGPGQKPDWAALSCAICFEGAVELSVGVSPEFRSFLRRCLEKDWEKRGKVCELLVHPFVRTSKSDTNEEMLRFLF